MFKEKIIIEMKEVFKEIPFGIEHTLKVLKNAEGIQQTQRKAIKMEYILYSTVLNRGKTTPKINNIFCYQKWEKPVFPCKYWVLDMPQISDFLRKLVMFW